MVPVEGEEGQEEEVVGEDRGWGVGVGRFGEGRGEQGKDETGR